MILKKTICVLVCLAVISCMAGCSKNSSSDSDKSSSASSNASSSSDSGSNSDTSSESGSNESSSNSSQQNSSASDSSQVQKKNAIGYDVKKSDRLYNKLKKTYENNYKAFMKSTANSGSELVIGVKNGKIYSSNKNQMSYRSMIYSGGKTATIINNTSRSYSEQTVTDAKKYVEQGDLLFGLAGEFVQAQFDEQNDIIGEYFKLKTENTGGQSGQICFCFLGSTGELSQMFITYDGSDLPIYFKLTQLSSCEDELFKLPDLSNFTKASQ